MKMCPRPIAGRSRSITRRCRRETDANAASEFPPAGLVDPYHTWMPAHAGGNLEPTSFPRKRESSVCESGFRRYLPRHVSAKFIEEQKASAVTLPQSKIDLDIQCNIDRFAAASAGSELPLLERLNGVLIQPQ